MSHAFISKISYRYHYTECIEIYECVYIYVYIKHAQSSGQLLRIRCNEQQDFRGGFQYKIPRGNLNNSKKPSGTGCIILMVIKLYTRKLHVHSSLKHLGWRVQNKNLNIVLHIWFTYRWWLILFKCQWCFKLSLAVGKHLTQPDTNSLNPKDQESMLTPV